MLNAYLMAHIFPAMLLLLSNISLSLFLSLFFYVLLYFYLYICLVITDYFLGWKPLGF